jgi:multidrug efflux pump
MAREICGLATGAGAEMRRSLGTAVLFGMLTCFDLLFTPAFYTFIRKIKPAS